MESKAPAPGDRRPASHEPYAHPEGFGCAFAAAVINESSIIMFYYYRPSVGHLELRNDQGVSPDSLICQTEGQEFCEVIKVIPGTPYTVSLQQSVFISQLTSQWFPSLLQWQQTCRDHKDGGEVVMMIGRDLYPN
jgi:hypothetical protein